MLPLALTRARTSLTSPPSPPPHLFRRPHHRPLQTLSEFQGGTKQVRIVCTHPQCFNLHAALKDGSGAGSSKMHLGQWPNEFMFGQQSIQTISVGAAVMRGADKRVPTRPWSTKMNPRRSSIKELVSQHMADAHGVGAGKSKAAGKKTAAPAPQLGVTQYLLAMSSAAALVAKAPEAPSAAQAAAEPSVAAPAPYDGVVLRFEVGRYKHVDVSKPLCVTAEALAATDLYASDETKDSMVCQQTLELAPCKT